MSSAIDRLRIDMTDWRRGPWWQRSALIALDRGWFKPMRARATDDLYLLRLWMSEPLKEDNGDLDSSDSLLLHYIVAPDDDLALHDHPWGFASTVLSGGIAEQVPNINWDKFSGWGPCADQVKVNRYERGDHYFRGISELHRIAMVLPDTWTLVRTTPRRSPWGFHPAKEKWRPWREHLQIRQAEADAIAQGGE